MNLTKNTITPIHEFGNHFLLAINDAIKYSRKYNVDTAVFINHEGTFLDREYKYCRDVNGEFNVVFVAVAKLNSTRRNKKGMVT